jgi:hypothetical protein
MRPCTIRPRRLALAAVAAFPTQASARAADINVPADQPTLQAGIDAAAPGDRVLVAPGTYFERIDFPKRATELRPQCGGSKFQAVKEI